MSMPESPRIDKFVALDFDRCLGNTNKCFDLLIIVLKELYPGVAEAVIRRRQEIEESGGSYSPYAYLRQNNEIDLERIKKRYLDLAKQEDLTEDGARLLIGHLNSTGSYFCILSYGDPEWQSLKIEAAGFGGNSVVIVDSAEKAKIISSWQNASKGFDIPKEYFKDLTQRTATEVVLVDDKIVSFDGLPSEARGYWVGDNRGRLVGSDAPPQVVRVSDLHEIIALEANLV